MVKQTKKAKLILPPYEWLSMEPMGSLYTAKNKFIRWLYLSRLKLALADIEHGDNTILDLGTGNGVLLPSLCEVSKKVVGLDNEEDMGNLDKIRDMISKTEYQDKSIDLQWGDAHQLAFPDHHFDYVLSVSILDHLEDLPRALGEMDRVLKPRGKLIVGIIPDNISLKVMRYLYRIIIGRMMGWKGDAFSAHINSFAYINQQLRSKFKIVKIRRLIGFLPWHLSPYISIVCEKK